MEKMIQFTGTKTVKACPMTLGEAEKVLKRHIDTSAVEGREQTPGYLVEYGEDGDNYRSWSPKEVFERAYRVSETHIDRMYIEKDHLKERYMKGREFTFTQQFRKLTENERRLLMEQLETMETYLYILSKRIELAEKEAAEKQRTQAPLGGYLIGGSVVKVGMDSCENCPHEPENCVKLYLLGGGYICIKEPDGSK